MQSKIQHKHIIAYSWLLLMLSVFSHADTVLLDNGDHLTGKLNSIKSDYVLLDSTASLEPLQIKEPHIDKIVFSKTGKRIPNHSERLILTNGDLLPCKILSMQDSLLNVSTWYAGNFSVKKEHVYGIEFGITSDKPIFIGQPPVKSWTNVSGKWNLSSNGYECRGSGYMARKLKLPEDVSFYFTLSWKETPNFAFRFCGQTNAHLTNQDCYQFLFNKNGMQVERFTENRKENAKLGSISIKPYQLPRKEVKIHLVAKRSENKVLLYIDSKLAGSWVDTFKKTAGDFIIFNDRTSQFNTFSIRDIAVTYANETKYRAPRKKRAHDLFVDNRGNQISGNLVSIDKNASDNERIISFRAQHTDKDTKIPEMHISALYFSNKIDPSANQGSATTFLTNQGQLQASDIFTENGKIQIKHPLLGTCSLDLRAINMIKKSKEN